jgi:hypothetical protein
VAQEVGPLAGFVEEGKPSLLIRLEVNPRRIFGALDDRLARFD